MKMKNNLSLNSLNNLKDLFQIYKSQTQPIIKLIHSNHSILFYLPLLYLSINQ